MTSVCISVFIKFSTTLRETLIVIVETCKDKETQNNLLYLLVLTQYYVLLLDRLLLIILAVLLIADIDFVDSSLFDVSTLVF